MKTRTPQQHSLTNLTSVLGFPRWWSTYDPNKFRSDLLAGVALVAFTVPEDMAYASLAGLPPQAGLYASSLAPLAYLLFGTSRQLTVGPTSALSILLASGLGELVRHHHASYAAMAALTGLMVGIISFLAWTFRLGFVVNFISEPVLTGTITGAALVIGASQVSKLLGIEGGKGEFFERIGYIFQHLGQINLPTLLLGLVGIALLLFADKRFRKFPNSLILVLLSIGLMSVTDLTKLGVKVVGTIPHGLPHLSLPAFTLTDVVDLLPLGLSVFLLSYVEGMSVARALAHKHRYPLDTNQELLALGVANFAAGLGLGYPVGGSLSRTAVNERLGANTPVASGIAALLVVVVILFLTGFFSNLPRAILAALVLIAIRGLFDIRGLRRIRRVSRREWFVAMGTFAAVLLFGILKGLLIGIVFSLLDLLERVSNPHTAILGRISGTDIYRDIKRHPENEQIPGVLIFRLDASLFFANTSIVHDRLIALIDKDPSIKLVVFDLAATPILDISGAAMLEDLHEQLAGRGITLKLADASGPVRDILRAEGLEVSFGKIEPNMTIMKVISEWQSHGTV